MKLLAPPVTIQLITFLIFQGTRTSKELPRKITKNSLKSFTLVTGDSFTSLIKSIHLEAGEIEPGESVGEGGPGGVLYSLVVPVERVLHHLLAVCVESAPVKINEMM